MTHEQYRTRTAKQKPTPQLVVWTSLWGRSLPYVLGEAEQKRRFSYALREAMAARDVSARQLARKLGVDPRRLARWLQEKDLPNLYEAQALASALAVDEELFRNPPEVPVIPPKPYYPIDQYLLDAVRRGTERAREVVEAGEGTDPASDGAPPDTQERPSA